MKCPNMKKLRETIAGMCPKRTDEISHAKIFEVFGLTESKEKDSLRGRMGDLVKRRELIRLAPGLFTYNPKAAPARSGESYIRIWRAIRAYSPGWSCQDLAQVTRFGISQVQQYVRFLEAEGYVARHGRKRNTKLYRATQKAKKQRDTPYPPTRPTDPFATEKSAACRLFRALMGDPSQPAVAKRIETECGIIMARFAGKETSE